MPTYLEASLFILGAPLVAAILTGFFGQVLGRKVSHCLALFAMAISAGLSLWLLSQWLQTPHTLFETTLYTWGQIGSLVMQVGLYVDILTVVMMVVVTSVSFLVHLYSIDYMQEDPGYQRFFSHISLFTWAMLVLVMSNNFLQLFFGWEAVGLVSYLLIGFWFKKETAVFANLKAFLINRVGDFGFLLGIAGVFYLFGSLDYPTVFQAIPALAAQAPVLSLSPHLEWAWLTVIPLALFVGAMGKSAQVPLHVWLPDSMEGPTPISALIHAATMVTAGVFMVARMSPLFEQSATALNVVLTIGAISCFSMGILGLVQSDIKRIIAYSTLSQLGYMVAALGASAYAVSIFHLCTHACFKALLFLGAGSVILALHHEQNIWKMGNLRQHLPFTFAVMLLGSLALIGFPLFSGFYSKDLIIEAVALSTLPAARISYWALLSSVFVTALYSFRLLFVVFLGPDRTTVPKDQIHENSWMIGLPLLVLAILSVGLGYVATAPILGGLLQPALWVKELSNPLPHLQAVFPNAWHYAMDAFVEPTFYFSMAGIFTAWLGYVQFPSLPMILRGRFSYIYRVLQQKYGFDAFYQMGLAPLARGLGWILWQSADKGLIDGLAVNGSAQGIGFVGRRLQSLQTGFLYHYAFAMVAGLLALLLGIALALP